MTRLADLDELPTNVACVMGNLGRDLELRTVSTVRGPTHVASTAVAVTQPNGGTLWVKLTFWGDRAEQAAAQLRKGMRIQVAGEVKQNKWTSPDGVDKCNIELTVRETLLVGKSGSPTNAHSGNLAMRTMGAAPLTFGQEEYDDGGFQDDAEEQW